MTIVVVHCVTEITIEENDQGREQESQNYCTGSNTTNQEEERYE